MCIYFIKLSFLVLCAGKADVCYPSCYKFVHSWESGEMEEKDGDRRRSRTSIHAGVTLFNYLFIYFLCSFFF